MPKEYVKLLKAKNEIVFNMMTSYLRKNAEGIVTRGIGETYFLMDEKGKKIIKSNVLDKTLNLKGAVNEETIKELEKIEGEF